MIYIIPKFCNRQVRSLRLPAEDVRQQARRRTCVLQVAVNEADSVKLVIPMGGKHKKNTFLKIH
ncbi:MAG: hypothetical protein ACI8ZB_005549 [Desulforhopalus sp.]|jgi:hypothetical protein